MSAGGAQTEQMEQMGQARQAGTVSTAALSVLVALGVIAVLAAAEYSIPRWLHPGAGDSGSFFSNKDSAPNPSGPRSASGPSIQPEPAGNTEAGHRNARASTRRISRDEISRLPAGRFELLGSQGAFDAAQAVSPSRFEFRSVSEREPAESTSAANGRTTARFCARRKCRLQQNIRTMEDATAHLVALEREELDHLSNRARALNGRIEEAERQQPAPARQLRDDWAFSQQRLQSHLNRADNALKSADVQTAKKFLDQAKTELEKLANLLAGQ